MPIVSKTRWQSMQILLDQVLDLPDEERTDYIDVICAGNPELKQDILDILAAEKRAPTFLEKPAHAFLHTFFGNTRSTNSINSDIHDSDTDEAQLNDTFIGSFKLVRELGRGGTGTVYLAQRHTGDFAQTVAIKVLRNNTQKRNLQERFKREQQLLASLDHPNIARLFDGGISEQGQAYLVMEYVDGLNIDDYCQSYHLNVYARLQLLQQVAQAVAYAHRHLIIHRDLKPSNILVKRDGTIKLLDFSIAKLLNEEDDMNLTQLGHAPMTPGFVAPEQLQNKAITVATDIYQLGLVAYFILSGVAAHSKAHSSLANLVQQVCTEFPRAPSLTYAEHRDKHCDKPGDKNYDEKYQRNLRGDVDAIVLKMLQVEPEQRYPSMDAFLQDVRAWFHCKPVSARHASWTYLTRRALQRHWKLAISIAGFFLFLLSYALTTTWQAHKIELALQKSQQERAKAEHVSGFLIKVFNAADPNISGFESVTAKQLLEAGEQRIIAELQQLPTVRNHMLNILAQIWQRQENYRHAHDILDSARAIANEQQQTHTPEFAKTLSLSGLNYLFTGENETALQFTQKGVDLYNALITEGSTSENDEYAYVLLIHAQVINNAFGRYADARPLVDRVIHILGKSDSINHEYLSYAYAELAFIQHMSGEFSAARQHMQLAADLQKRATGENHTYYTTMITNLAILYRDAEEFDKAEELVREALRIHENIFGSAHVSSLHTKRTAAVIFHRQGKLEEAEQLLANIAEQEATLDQSTSYEGLSTQLRLAAVLQDKGDYKNAAMLNENIVAQLQQQADSELHARAVTQLASVKYQQQEYESARQLFAEALLQFEEQSVIRTIAELGAAQTAMALKQSEQALLLAKTALDKRKQSFFIHHSWVVEAELVYALALLGAEENDIAHALLDTALQKARSTPGLQFGDRRKLLQTASDLSNQ